MTTTQIKQLNLESSPEENLRFLRFVELLNHVSTRNRTSSPSSVDVLCNGLIDKMEFEVCASLTSKQLNKNTENLGLNIGAAKLNNKHWYERVSYNNSPWNIHFRKHFATDTITEIISNPSDFESLEEYSSTVQSLIFPRTFNDLKIKRLDLTCDYEMAFGSFIQCLDIINKRKKITHTSSEITGIYFGQKPNLILAYDKSEELKSHVKPISRLELSLTGKALPFKEAHILNEPKSFLEKITKCKPFAGAELFELSFNDDSQLTHEFKIHLKSQGFQAARQQMNKNKNFHRDIEPLLTRKPFTKQPSEALIEGLKRFCYGGEREQSSHLRPRIF